MKILSAQASQDIAVIVLAALVAAVAVVIVGLIISLLVTRKRLENRAEGAQSPPAEQSVQDTPAVQTDEAVAEEQPPAVAEENIAATQKTDNSADIHILPVIVAGGNTRFNIRYNKSFTAKLIQSSDEVKGWYATLKNALLSYKKTKSRISWHTDSINCGRIKLAKFAIRGKTLRLYLALNPEDYAETKYKVEYGEGKRYEAVPCMYRIKNSRRVKYALELIAALAEKYGLILTEREDEDYYLPYEETAPLLARGLIKEINGAPSAEDAEEIEEVAEEAEEEIPEEVEQAEEVAATQPPESDGEAAEEESEEEPEEEPEELSESEKEDVEEYDGHSDDEDGIPVIGVMFRRRGKKVYWFDPDGKQWQKGEIAHYVAPDGLRHEVIVVDMAKRSPDKLHLPLKPLHKLRQSNK